MDERLTRRGWIVGGALAAVGAGALVLRRGGGSSLVKVEGSSALSPFMLAVSEGFRRSHGGDVEVRSTDEARALQGLRRGEIDVAMLGRELRPDERDFVGTRLAVDGVGIVVNADNPVRELPADAWRDLFAGVKRDWPGYGGPNANVTLLERPEGSAARGMLHGLLHITQVRADAEVMEGDGRMVTRIAGDVGAIGYGSIAMIEAAIRQGAGVRLLPLERVQAAMTTVTDGTYPLRVVLSLATARAPKAPTRDLMTYVRSGTGLSLLRAHGYTPTTG